MRRSLGLLLVTALAAAAAPAPFGDGKQLPINSSTPLSNGERGPASVYSLPPTIVVPKVKNVQVGERPFYLVDNMTDSSLKTTLESCTENPLRPTQFSISHRGAALQFPEHTLQGIRAAARQGAGVIECDVAFTSDRKVVCRHSQCDLHSTTNVLTIPELAGRCNQTFTPAADGEPASAYCCTSDFTLAEIKSLCGKQEGFNTSATNPQDALRGTPVWRTELYDTCGEIVSHSEFIAEVDQLGLSFTTEAKEPVVPMPFQGDYTQEAYLQQVVDDYKNANIHPSRVWLQSFRYSDILEWIKSEPEFARQAVYLDERTDTPEGLQQAIDSMKDVAAAGVQIIAPSFPWLLSVDNSTGELVASEYAKAAKQAGLKIITWSLERSGPLLTAKAKEDSYYTGLIDWLKNDGQILEVVHALAQKVKVIGIFSDWPATVTYYANCFGLLGGYQDPDRN